MTNVAVTWEDDVIVLRDLATGRVARVLKVAEGRYRLLSTKRNANE